MSFRSSIWLIAACVTTSLSWSAVAEERISDLAGPKKSALHESDYGLTFCYAEMKDVKHFLTSTPCVSGVWWKFRAEDDKHFIGELHYPTENTADYHADARRLRSPKYFMVTDIAIRKQEGLPIDLKTFRGALVLRDPKPDTPLAVRGDGTSYELVGYEDKRSNRGDFRFLFSINKDLKFTPPKK